MCGGLWPFGTSTAISLLNVASHHKQTSGLLRLSYSLAFWNRTRLSLQSPVKVQVRKAVFECVHVEDEKQCRYVNI